MTKENFKRLTKEILINTPDVLYEVIPEGEDITFKISKKFRFDIYHSTSDFLKDDVRAIYRSGNDVRSIRLRNISNEVTPKAALSHYVTEETKLAYEKRL